MEMGPEGIPHSRAKTPIEMGATVLGESPKRGPKNPGKYRRTRSRREAKKQEAPALPHEFVEMPSDEVVARVKEALDKMGKEQPEIIAEARAELAGRTKEIESKNPLAVAREREAFEAACAAGNIDTLPEDNSFKQAVGAPAMRRALDAISRTAQELAAVEVPERAGTFAAGKPLRAAMEKFGVRAGVELGALPLAAMTLLSSVKTKAYEAAYAHGIQANPLAVDLLSAAVALGAVAGIAKGKHMLRDTAAMQGTTRVYTGALLRSLAERPFMTSAAMASLMAATVAATSGLEKAVSTTERNAAFGATAQEKLAVLQRQITEAQPAITDFLKELHERVDWVLLMEKDPKAGAAAHPEWIREGVAQSTGHPGAGPQWAAKTYFFTGQRVPMDKGSDTAAGRAKLDGYIAALEQVRPEGIRSGEHIADFIARRSEALQAQNSDIFKEFALLTLDIQNAQDTNPMWYFVGNITGEAESAVDAIRGVKKAEGGSGGDPYVIPRRVERLIEMIQTLKKEEKELLDFTQMTLNIASGKAMSVIGAGSQQIDLPALELAFDTGALAEIQGTFPKAAVTLLPTEDDWKYIEGYIKRIGGTAFDAHNPAWKWGLVLMLLFAYGRVVDLNVTPGSVRYEGARKKFADEHLPERLKELQDTEDVIAQRIASLLTGEFESYGQVLLGDSAPISHEMLPAYIRFELHNLALAQAQGIKDKQSFFMKGLLGISEKLRSQPPEEVTAYNEVYIKFLEGWKERLAKGDLSALDELVDRIYPGFSQMRAKMLEMSQNPAPDAQTNSRRLTSIEKDFVSARLDQITSQLEFFKYRIVVIRYALEQMRSQGGATAEFFKSDALLPLSGKGSIGITANEARQFYAFSALSQRLAAEEREFRELCRSGVSISLSRWRAEGGKGNFQIPEEFAEDFSDMLKNPAAYGLAKDMLDAYSREVMQVAQREVNPDALSGLLSRINNEAIRDFKKHEKDLLSKDLKGYAVSFEYAYDPAQRAQTVRATLAQSGKTIGVVSYPGVVPNERQSPDKTLESVREWLEGPVSTELQAHAAFYRQSLVVENLEGEMRRAYPGGLIPVSGDASRVVALLNAQAGLTRQRLRLEDRGSLMTRQELGAFHHKSVKAEAIAGIGQIFKEIGEALPPGTTAGYDIATGELVITRRQAIGERIPFLNRAGGKGEAKPAEARLPLEKYRTPGAFVALVA